MDTTQDFKHLINLHKLNSPEEVKNYVDANTRIGISLTTEKKPKLQLEQL